MGCFIQNAWDKVVSVMCLNLVQQIKTNCSAFKMRMLGSVNINYNVSSDETQPGTSGKDRITWC